MKFVGVMFVTAAVAMTPLVPTEHVHERLDSGGHVHLFAHRHGNHHSTARAKSGPVIDDEEPLFVVDSFFATPLHPFVPHLVLSAVPTVREAGTRDVMLSEILSQPIHGPPQSTFALRAPPASPFL